MKIDLKNRYPPIVIRPIKKNINLATFTNGNDAANKSYVDGVKQAATSVFVPVYCFNFVMGHDYKKEITFLRSRSKYAVSNDLHSTVYSDKLTFDVDGTYEFH